MGGRLGHRPDLDRIVRHAEIPAQRRPEVVLVHIGSGERLAGHDVAPAPAQGGGDEEPARLDQRRDVAHEQEPRRAVSGGGVRAVGADHGGVPPVRRALVTGVDPEELGDLLAGEVLAGRHLCVGGAIDPLAPQGVADEGSPVVGAGLRVEPPPDLREVGRQVVAEVDLGGHFGRREHVVQRGPDPEEQDRPVAVRTPHGADEVRDGGELIGLDRAVVVGQVFRRHPVGVERGVDAAAQERSGEAGEAVLVEGGADVGAGQEEQGLVRGDRVAEDGGAERARVVRQFLGDLGADIADGRGHARRAGVPGHSPGDVMRDLGQHIGAGARGRQQVPVRPDVGTQGARPDRVARHQYRQHPRMADAAEQAGGDQ